MPTSTNNSPPIDAEFAVVKSESKPASVRPTIYSDAVAQAICDRMSEGESLRQICRDPDMPYRYTVKAWRRASPDFETRYARAREELYEHWANEITEISDDGSNDWMEIETKSGRMVNVIDHDHIARSRLRVESRKWLLSKLVPHQYGDRVTVNGSVAHAHTVAVTGAITLEAAEQSYLELVRAPAPESETVN